MPLPFLLLALSWLLERSLEDLRLLALARCLLVGSSLAAGDTDRELLSLEPERVPERVLRCSRATRFLLVFFLPRELERERERERDGDRSSTILWVVSCGTAGLGGPSGSRTVTQVTVRSSEPKKVSQGSLSSSQGSGAGEARPRLPVGSSSAAPAPLSLSEDGPREASASVSKTFSTV